MKALKVLIEKLKRAFTDKVVLGAVVILLAFGIVDLFFNVHFQGILLFYVIVVVGVILKYEFVLDVVEKNNELKKK